MAPSAEKTIQAIVTRYGGDATRLMDVQDELGFLSHETAGRIAQALGIPHGDVEQTTSFYHFFARAPRGTFAVYLNDGVVGLFHTACIGMSDQEPAALVNLAAACAHLQKWLVGFQR